MFMKSRILFSSVMMLCVAGMSASVLPTESASVLADTANVLGEVVVVEKAAKAPVALLPLDVRIVGSDISTTAPRPTSSRYFRTVFPACLSHSAGSPAMV